jgi:tRNA (guanine-N7-)-methyltransferase
MHAVNLTPITSTCFLPPETLTAMPDWSLVFGNDNPLALEIGCGVGDFVVQMATLHPECNFVAVDYYNRGCLKTARRIDKAGVENVRVIRDEIRAVMSRCIPRSALRMAIINCPDPWPKKRHRKRRLVQAEFVEYLAGFMRPGADFFFATDFDDYAEDVARMMPCMPGFENLLAPDPYRHRLDGYPLSKYMRKFMAEGKQVYFIHYRKTP